MLTNPVDLPLQGDEWPAPGRCSFVVIVREPRDFFGNLLNPIAFVFDAPKLPGPAVVTISSRPKGPPVV